ncbi:MAG: sialidase family protein [Acidobacteriota bacterium]
MPHLPADHHFGVALSARPRPGCSAHRRLGIGLLILGSLALGCSARNLSAPRLGAEAVGPAARAEATEALLARVAVRDGVLHVEPPTTRRTPATTDEDLVTTIETLLQRGGRVAALELLLDAAADDRVGVPSRAWMLLGHLLERAGAEDEALAALDEALGGASVDERPLYQAALARALGRRQRHAEAAEAWSRVASEADVGSLVAAEAARRFLVERYFAGQPLGEEIAAALATLSDAPSDRLLRALIVGGAPPRARVETFDRTVAAERFAVHAAVRVDTGGAAEVSEPSIVALGDEVVVAWNDERDLDGSGRWRVGVGVSTDGGATWTDQLLREPPPPAQDGDPMTAVDARTGSLWVGAIRFNLNAGEVFVARRPAGGPLEPPVLVNAGSGFDKCWMSAGIAPGQPDSTRLYVAYSLPSSLQRSSDLGATWSPVVELDPGGLAFLPRVGPTGELEIGYFEFDDWIVGDEMRLQRSLDGGVTVGAPRVVARRLDVWDLQDGSRVPGRFRLPTIPIWSVDPGDGTLYLVYFDTTAIVDGNADLDLYVLRSSDGGATWTEPRALALAGDQFFPWLEVDRDGVLHMVYFDSRHTVQDDDALDGRFDVYYATSADRGDSWTEIRLTDTPFGTAGIEWPVFGQFLGDYLGLTVLDDAVLVSYPRTGGADLDLYVQRVERTSILIDGFETGDFSAWTGIAP